MKAAVTGGSGVVGAALVRHLAAAGHEALALARSSEAATALSDLGATPVDGDVLDPPSITQLVTGAETVFHVAGINELCTRRPEMMWKVNVGGTANVLDACIAEGVTRVVHTSSAVTIGEMHGVVADESTPHRGSYLSVYERTKAEAERLALAQADIEVVSVNPSSVQGPGRAGGTGRLVLAAARGRLPVMVDTSISVVDIDDCARGHLLAAEQGVAGERYLLSGASIGTREALRLVAEIIGRPSRTRFIDPHALILAGALGGVAARFRLRSEICPESVRVILHGHRYDGSRATRELGLSYTPLAETLRRTVHWFDVRGLSG